MLPPDPLLPSEIKAILNVDEYICQSLDYNPQSISDSVLNAVFAYMAEAMIALQTTLKHEFGDLVSESELNEGTKRISDEFLSAAKETFMKLDDYLFNNIFHVPDVFVFPEDEIQLKLDASEAEDKILNQEMNAMLQQIKEQKLKNACLEQQKLDLNKTASEYTKMIDLFRNLENIAQTNEIFSLDEIQITSHELSRIQKGLEN